LESISEGPHGQKVKLFTIPQKVFHTHKELEILDSQENDFLNG